MDEVKRLNEELARERERIISECAQKVQDILKEYNCGIVATPQIQDGRIVAVVQIVAL